AWLLESPEELPPAVRVWAAALEPADMELNFPPREASWEEKWQSLAPLFYPTPPAKRDWQDLFPDWIKTCLAPEEKVELRVLLKWLQARPPLWLRAQISDVQWLCRELSEQGATVIRHPEMKFALRCEAKSLNLRAMSTFRQGDFEIQDLASQTVAMVCDPKPGEQWWDACAGGGGKTLHLAWLMQGKGSVLASDIRTHKLEELKLRARRAQFPNIRCKEWKGKEMPKWKDRFAGVLVDTPCSCSGTWRRNPDARWNSRPEELTEFNRLQLQLLNNAAAAVAPGGTLVYSTCSMFITENQDVVTTFLAGNPQFSLCPFRCPLSGRENDGMRQIWPWEGDCDAMFTAKMRRCEVGK
ncbi:MAG: RsmB/NOP family class I SAM-dependent RNA methyltransferase, partial [Lentisphaeria bacterium]